MRRWLAPLILVVLVLGASTAAIRADADPTVEPLPGPRTVTPVLSARRVPAFLAAPVGDRRLQAALGSLVSRGPADTCLAVSATGRPLFSARPDQPLVPASAVKLLTATAVLEALGPDTRLRTVVASTDAAGDGVVEGDLWVIGGGDPLLATDAYSARFESQPQIETDFEALADRLVDRGLRTIRGSVRGDDSRFDADRYPDGWPERYLTQHQSGPLSALSVNDGFEVFPANPDDETDPVPAADPPMLAASLLTALLQQRGVQIDGPPGSGRAPADAAEVAALDSHPMDDVVIQMLRESDNNTAELLVKELGRARNRSGSTAAGVRAAAEVLSTIGLGDTGVRIADGSGLDEANRLTCNVLLRALDRAGPQSTLASGLPVAGQTGTLRERFLDSPAAGRLRAKTGTLNHVTALAGFVDTAQGQVLTFAYMANPTETVDEELLALQDELGAVLVRYPEGPALAELGPKPLPGAGPGPGG